MQYCSTCVNATNQRLIQVRWGDATRNSGIYWYDCTAPEESSPESFPLEPGDRWPMMATEGGDCPAWAARKNGDE